MKAHAVEHVQAGQAAWREIEIGEPGADEVLVAAEFSAISAGTESLLFSGNFPGDCPLDALIPALQRRFAYPVRYGYALVGRVTRVGDNVDSDWLGRRVFLFHPHQDFVRTRLDGCWPVPEDIANRAGCFLPNVESAVNFVMDARPIVGERLLVVGLGVLGLLTTAILMQFPLAELVVVDRLSSRRTRGQQLGARVAAGLDELHADGIPAGAGFDTAIELSGNMRVLDPLIDAMGFGGRIVVGSWYGTQRESVSLGGVFHRRRLTLISSQVSTLAAEFSARWDKTRRLALAWEWVRRINPERWITHTFPPTRCQEAFELAAEPNDGVLQVIFDYQ